MEKLGKEQDSKSYWCEAAQRYVDALTTPYHQHRLKVAFDLIPPDLMQASKVVYDFGCGDGVMFEPFLKAGVNISGCDIVPDMIQKAKAQLERLGHDSSAVFLGGVNCLKELADESLDGLISFNVLAYLSESEEFKFYTEANRVIKKNGYLAVSHSNKLFDLFSLNRYTADFFQEEFSCVATEFLARAEQPALVTTYNVRENPLNYKFKLAKFGFEETAQRFSNLHKSLPGLKIEKDYPNTLDYGDEISWKLMFMCSTYMSLSHKI